MDGGTGAISSMAIDLDVLSNEKPLPQGKMRSRLDGRLIDSPAAPVTSRTLAFSPIVPVMDYTVDHVAQVNSVNSSMEAISQAARTALHPAYAKQWSHDQAPVFDGQPSGWYNFSLEWPGWFGRTGFSVDQKVVHLGASLKGDLRLTYISLQNQYNNSLTFEEVWNWLVSKFGKVPPATIKHDWEKCVPTKKLDITTLTMFELAWNLRRDRYAGVVGGIGCDRQRDVLLNALPGLQESLILKEVDRQASQYWFQITGMPRTEDFSAFYSLPVTVGQPHVQIGRIISRVVSGTFTVCVKVSNAHQVRCMVQALNGKPLKAGGMLHASEWQYSLDPPEIFRELRKKFEKDFNKSQALQANLPGVVSMVSGKGKSSSSASYPQKPPTSSSTPLYKTNYSTAYPSPSFPQSRFSTPNYWGPLGKSKGKSKGKGKGKDHSNATKPSPSPSKGAKGVTKGKGKSKGKGKGMMQSSGKGGRGKGQRTVREVEVEGEDDVEYDDEAWAEWEAQVAEVNCDWENEEWNEYYEEEYDETVERGWGDDEWAVNEVSYAENDDWWEYEENAAWGDEAEVENSTSENK